MIFPQPTFLPSFDEVKPRYVEVYYEKNKDYVHVIVVHPPKGYGWNTEYEGTVYIKGFNYEEATRDALNYSKFTKWEHDFLIDMTYRNQYSTLTQKQLFTLIRLLVIAGQIPVCVTLAVEVPKKEW